MNKNIHFTPREKEILKLIVKAKQRKIIADILKFSIHTLDKHIHSIHNKTGTHSLAELVLWASHNKHLFKN